MNSLLLDIGNSRLKWGVLADGALRDTGHMSLHNMPQELPSLQSQLPEQPGSVIACNVAGADVAATITEILAAGCGTAPQFVQSSATAGGVQNAYAQPERLGVDRWVALIGARAATDSACLVVDAGTAITLDAMDPGGRHLGGQILPGLHLMAAALNRNTSDLPVVDASNWGDIRPEAAFASSTPDAISRGILSAVLGAIDRGLQSQRKKFPDATLLLTGGDAEVITQHLSIAAELRPHLVLEGLACLAAGEAAPEL